MKISVIIVNYNNGKDLIECLDSLYKYTKSDFEVVVVDNSEKDEVSSLLKSEYKNIKYKFAGKNLGYGAGINLGVKQASGEYLFILNPDVIFEKDIITPLLNKFKTNKKIGILAPTLFDTNGKRLEQGAKELTPLMALFKLSFLNKLFPNNFVSKNYWIDKWQTKNLIKVDNAPGTAFFIKKDLFNSLGGFDEEFFLYFEEFDLCKRVREKGYEIYIDPNLVLTHKWGTSTKLVKNINEIFNKSRFYYFRKHFGFLRALSIEAFLSVNKESVIFILIFLSALAVRLYKIDSLVPFIGDQGWFFISARDALLNHSIPLVGITSSHVWLHQGPLWTYIVALMLTFFRFNLAAPFYFTAFLDVLTLILVYKVCKEVFSYKTALFAGLIYAFSPVVILSSRMAYHTSPIPFFTILFFYFTYKWIKGNMNYFPLSILTVFILYNFELQNFVLIIFLGLILAYGFLKKKVYFHSLFNKKTIIFSIAAFAIPMLPILIYDINNGFSQTIVFAGWTVYKAFSFVTHIGSNTSSVNVTRLGSYFYEYLHKLLYIQNAAIAVLLFGISFAYLIFKNINDFIKKKLQLNLLLIDLFLFILFLAIIFAGTASDAYLMSLFVPSIIIVAIFLEKISINKPVFVGILLVVFVSLAININILVSNNYFTGVNKHFGPSLEDRILAAKFMIKDSGRNSFRVVGMGPGSQFASFTANYQYLAWYFGKEPQKNGKVVYSLTEYPNGIKIERKN